MLQNRIVMRVERKTVLVLTPFENIAGNALQSVFGLFAEVDRRRAFVLADDVLVLVEPIAKPPLQVFPAACRVLPANAKKF